MTKVERSFKVFSEEISPDNVLVMAELIALKSTKHMIRFAGYYAEKIHNRLYRDIMNKDNTRYIISDSYDLVQSVAAYLCEHFGEHLSDLDYTAHRGKVLSIELNGSRLVNNAISLKYRRLQSDISLEIVPEICEPCFEPDYCFDLEKSFERAEEIIELMDLTDTHKIILESRIAGISYPEIARNLNRCLGTIGDLMLTIQRRYKKVLKSFE